MGVSTWREWGRRLPGLWTLHLAASMLFVACSPPLPLGRARNACTGRGQGETTGPDRFATFWAGTKCRRAVQICVRGLAVLLIRLFGSRCCAGTAGLQGRWMLLLIR